MFMFGVTQKTLSKKTVKLCERIAKDEDASFVYVGKQPGNLSTGWFSARNYGAPFDDQRASRVRAALSAAGIDLF